MAKPGTHYSHRSILQCRAVVAKAIVEGQAEGCNRLLRQSMANPFLFYINGQMYDETKLWYMVPGMGFREFSTLGHHSQVTWKDAEGIEHDEDIIRPPAAMVRYVTENQLHILTNDATAGPLQHDGLRPLARFYGTITMSDSHPVNLMTVKVLC